MWRGLPRRDPVPEVARSTRSRPVRYRRVVASVTGVDTFVTTDGVEYKIFGVDVAGDDPYHDRVVEWLESRIVGTRVVVSPVKGSGDKEPVLVKAICWGSNLAEEIWDRHARMRKADACFG